VNKALRLVLCAALPLLGAAACSDFLTGGELSNDPNRPLTANRDLLFLGTQASLWRMQTGELARATSMWVQQMEGGERQYELMNNYELNESTFDSPFSDVYAQGGLVDLRKIQNEAREVGDSTYLGIAQVMEALVIGTAASLWGDIPYSKALQGEPPALDAQADVYNQVQTLLDEAIVNLSKSGPTNIGPNPRTRDLVYGAKVSGVPGLRSIWTELANTLKARFYLHMAKTDNSMYGRALAAAELGLSTADHDYTSIHSGKPGEENLWYQFMEDQRPGYIGPNLTFAHFLEDRHDPRLELYFDSDIADSVSYLSEDRISNTFSQPIVTWAENQLIWAEAAFRTNDEGTARNKLTEVRRAVGLTDVPASTTGNALLAEILAEKYIQLFQNIEAWNGYKRTCFPNLEPVVAGKKITARLFYGTSERQTNPNIPAAGQQPTRNPNDPPAATDPLGNACLGQ
jgi:hypothetical protein